LLVSDFDFDLPAQLIAQEPRPRGTSRLMVVRRAQATFTEHTIRDLPALLEAGDLLVANDTEVFPARLLGRRDPSGGAVECLLLERLSDDEWLALVHPGQKLKAGARVVFEDAERAPGVRLSAEILERKFFGRRRLRLTVDAAAPASIAGPDPVMAAIDALGHVPLPPYIQRDDRADDRERYQTIFARVRGSIAAPTAGLHFDDALIAALRDAGVGWTTVTHHVGYGTFKPVRVEHVEDHRVDPERYTIPTNTLDAIARTKAAGRRVVAVGTTTTRALESAGAGDPRPRESTDLFIFPGYRFRVIDALLTNFHLPRSSLLMLVAAFAGRDLILDAYRDAIRREFRFYSYGDAMLIL
jgi:S-adenosylmethionine:tRNA ribosyltransferase-isomerase